MRSDDAFSTRDSKDDDRQIVVRKVRKTSTGVTLYFEEHDATCDAV